MAVKKDTVKDTPLGTVTDNNRDSEKTGTGQKGYHGSEDAQSQTTAEAEAEQAQQLEQDRLDKQGESGERE